MLNLQRPTQSAGEVYSICIRRVRNQELKRRLEGISQDIVDAASAYEVAALRTRLHMIPAHDEGVGTVTKEELSAVYTSRMAQKDAPGRFVYDQLISAAPQGRCPLCGQRFVSTLDHYLPKAHYPSLAVTPLNLVPSCGECNRAKLDSFPQEAGETPLHPYFDNIDRQRWLCATVIETHPAALTYYVSPPAGWPILLAERVKTHFKMLGLGRLYAAEASEEIFNIAGQLQTIHEFEGPAGVQAELRERAASCLQARRNGWRTAAYMAFAESEWFCNDGFSVANK